MKQALLLISMCAGLGTATAQEVRTRTTETSTQAQPTQRSFSGRVVDNQGTPIVGATVRLVDRSTGAIVTGGYTDSDGRFSFTTRTDAQNLVVQVSYVGMADLSLPAQENMNVTMTESDEMLDDVVITGYAAQRRSTIAGATNSASGDVVTNIPVQTLDRGLQGVLPGVQVVGATGLPGSNTQVRIRGIASLSAGRQPLYIIDGVQVTPDDVSTSLASANPLAALNPNDIETFTVLKDAAAAAQYGAQAANGVIIVTTKKGQAGKTVVSLNAYAGYTERLRKYDAADGPEFARLGFESYVNRGVLPNDEDVFASFFDGPQFNDDGSYNSLAWPTGRIENAPNYDWEDEVTRRGFTQNYDLSMRGGNEKTTFYVSAGYMGQEAHYIGTSFERGSFRLNLDHKINDRFNVFTRLNLGTSIYSQATPAGAVGQNNYIISNILTASIGLLPTFPFRDPSGNLTIFEPTAFTFSPLHLVDVNRLDATQNSLVGQFGFDAKIIDGLTWRSTASIEFLGIREDQFTDPTVDETNNGAATARYNQRVNWQTNHVLSYNRTFAEDHDLTAFAGLEFRQEVFTSFQGTQTDFAIEGLRVLSAGATPFATAQSETEWRLLGLFAKVGYSYRSKYIAEVTVRRDGSSRFGENTRFGVFPGVALAWRMSEEPFWEPIRSVVSDAKLRLSYGELGNQSIGNFAARGLLGLNGLYNGNRGLTISQLGNADLSWESSVTYNVGLDLSLFRDRVTITSDAYIRRSENLLQNVPLAPTSGFGSFTDNIGELENRGIELGIVGRVLRGDVKWNVDFNIAFNDNEITSLAQGDVPGAGLFVGSAIGSTFLARYAGVNPADGRPMWLDINGNYTYNPQAADRVVGRSTLVPDYFGGFGTNVSWNGITLDARFSYQFGTVLFNANDFYLSEWLYGTLAGGIGSYVMTRWTTPGQITSVPRLYQAGQSPGAQASSISGGSQSGHDRFFQDNSFLRLRQVRLSYDLPKEWLSRIGMAGVQVYVAGTNLLTWTPYTGFDPEVNAGTLDNGVIPQSKSVIGGVQLSF